MVDVQYRPRDRKKGQYFVFSDDDDEDEGEYELSQNGYHHPGTFSDMEGQILMIF